MLFRSDETEMEITDPWAAEKVFEGLFDEEKDEDQVLLAYLVAVVPPIFHEILQPTIPLDASEEIQVKLQEEKNNRVTSSLTLAEAEAIEAAIGDLNDKDKKSINFDVYLELRKLLEAVLGRHIQHK